MALREQICCSLVREGLDHSPKCNASRDARQGALRGPIPQSAACGERRGVKNGMTARPRRRVSHSYRTSRSCLASASRTLVSSNECPRALDDTRRHQRRTSTRRRKELTPASVAGKLSHCVWCPAFGMTSNTAFGVRVA